MKQVEYRDVEEFVNLILDEYEWCDNVTIACRKNHAVELMKEFLDDETVELIRCEILDEEFDEYDKEYYVTLLDGCDLIVEPAYSIKNGEYLLDISRYAFVHEDCNSKILESLETIDGESAIFEYRIVELDGEDDWQFHSESEEAKEARDCLKEEETDEYIDKIIQETVETTLKRLSEFQRLLDIFDI